MNRDETIALFEQGRDAWNAWAQEMEEKRQALIDAGEWVESSVEADWNRPTRAWYDKAFANFSRCHFKHHVSFDGYEFPAAASFELATFEGDASFSKTVFKAKLKFRSAKFRGSADFFRVTFPADAVFMFAKFNGNPKFYGTRFVGRGRFDQAQFQNDVSFGNAIFENGAIFSKSEFNGDAEFGSSIFNSAVFSGVTFRSESRFALAKFRGYTAFERSIFHGAASFRAIRSESAFSLAKVVFVDVPDFGQAHFEEAPRLDNVSIEPQSKWAGVHAFFNFTVASKRKTLKLRRSIKSICRNSIGIQLQRGRCLSQYDRQLDRVARWRALKRLAVQAHDHKREQDFFKGEMLARRWVEDRPWHAVYWAGLAYQWLSDFGQSLLRPLVWLGLATTLFAAAYLDIPAQTAPADRVPAGYFARVGQVLGLQDGGVSCTAGAGSAVGAAWQLSVRRALVLPGIAGGEALEPHYACLYGAESRPPQPTGQLVPPYRPVVPDAVGYLGLLQGLVSAILLFLLLLAIRNHFRIK